MRGGIFSEWAATEHWEVDGVDASVKAITVATNHAKLTWPEQKRQKTEETDPSHQTTPPRYHHGQLEQLQQQTPECYIEQFDAVVCLEVLEHVPHPQKLIEACSKSLRPGGLLVLSTINRTFKSLALGILAAEWIFNLVPRQTHRHADFIRPDELASWLNHCRLKVVDCSGLQYSPATRRAQLKGRPDINYFMAAWKD